MMKVIKRDGKIVDFDKKKIKDAIFKSMKYGSGIIKRKVATEIANEIEKEYIKCGVTQSTVLGIENAVYNKLIEKGEKETACAKEISGKLNWLYLDLYFIGAGSGNGSDSIFDCSEHFVDNFRR